MTKILPTLNPSLFPQITSPYNLPDVFGRTTQLVGMDLILYIIFSAVYIMFIHFAVGIKDEFKIFGMLGYFIAGGLIGAWFHNYEAGFIFGVILSLIFF